MTLMGISCAPIIAAKQSILSSRICPHNQRLQTHDALLDIWKSEETYGYLHDHP